MPLDDGGQGFTTFQYSEPVITTTRGMSTAQRPVFLTNRLEAEMRVIYIGFAATSKLVAAIESCMRDYKCALHTLKEVAISSTISNK